jgi:polysaccharide biosynthesis protein PslH
MKILFITQLLPYPPYTGGKCKTFSILKILAKSHQVHLVTFHTRKIDLEQIKKLEALLNIKVKSFFHPLVTAPSKDIKFTAFKSIFSNKPFRVYKYFHLPMAQYLSNLTQKIRFDQFHLDHNTSIQYLPNLNNSSQNSVFYHEHNINSIAMLRMFRYSRRHPISRLFILLDALKNYFYEKRIVKEVPKILAISPTDRQLLIKRGALKKSTQVLPTPFTPKPLFKYSTSSPTIIIIGLMSWAPNKIGTLWFGNYVYPIIKQSIPNCKLFIIGPNPCRNIFNLEQTDPSITVTDKVDSLDPYYQKANLLVAPIPFGSGIRIKILHALASGVPIVSTPIGAEGINPRKKNGVIIAPYQTQPFAKAVIKLMSNKKNSLKLSQQGLNLIKNYYSENQSSKILLKF